MDKHPGGLLEQNVGCQSVAVAQISITSDLPYTYSRALDDIISISRWTLSLFTTITAIGLTGAAAHRGYSQTLPNSARHTILWRADHEEGSLADWTMPGTKWPGGGILNTGGKDVSATASRDVAHSGQWSVKTVITGARRAQNGARAVRLMRWTDKAWDQGGHHFPNHAFYATWIYFDQRYNPNKHKPWNPGDGGWWNVMQFKSENRHGKSQPVWTLNVAYDEQQGHMFLYLFSQPNRPSAYQQTKPLPIPARKWIHLVAYYESATGKRGRIRLWQDGRQIFDVSNVVTSLGGKNGNDTHPIWGIGNYTDHVSGDSAEEGTATIYFDDATVSTSRPNERDEQNNSSIMQPRNPTNFRVGK